MKWTQEMRRKLYSRLVKDFGPYHLWGTKTEPQGTKVQFDEVLAELAKEFSKEAGRIILASAVQAQFNWATSSRKEIIDQSRVRGFVLNKAAALDAGFIAKADLPTRMICEYGNPPTESLR